MMMSSRELLDVLFASLWQGASIACFAAVALFATRRRLNAATRYVILQGALVAIVLVAVSTVAETVVKGTPPVGSRLAVVEKRLTTAADSDSASQEPQAKATHRAGVSVNDFVAGGIVIAWASVALILGIRVAVGFIRTARILRGCERLPAKDGIRVFACSKIALPIAVGFRNPAIVLPASLTRDDSEVEAVLLHELGHIRRGDIWANLAERIVHALLFFNPAVVVLLRAIAYEREAACDDWALARGQDLDGYVRSLASFALAGADRRAKMFSGASGFGRSILARIRRLEDDRRIGTTGLAPIFVSSAVLGLSFAGLAIGSLAPVFAFDKPEPNVVAETAPSTCADVPVSFLGGPRATEALPSHLTSLVRVRISSSGSLIGALISKSSGDNRFDRIVVALARKSTWAPAMHHCQRVVGSYLFRMSTENGPFVSPPTELARGATCESTMQLLGPDPPGPRSLPQGLTTRVFMRVSPSGSVAETLLLHGSGRADFDQRLIRWAQVSRWTPAVSQCRPLPRTVRAELTTRGRTRFNYDLLATGP